MALDEPDHNDKIKNVDGIRIGIEPYIADYMDDAVIDYQQFLWMKQLIVLSSIGSSC